jgi:uncharacterized protein YqeY
MPLKQKLADDLKDAMRAGDETRKSTLRMLIAAIKNAEVPSVTYHEARPGQTWESVASQYGVGLSELVESNPYIYSELLEDDPRPFEGGECILIPGSESGLISEEAIREVISVQADQRRESIEVFRRANRPELVNKETSELRILDEYLSAAGK